MMADETDERVSKFISLRRLISFKIVKTKRGAFDITYADYKWNCQ